MINFQESFKDVNTISLVDSIFNSLDKINFDENSIKLINSIKEDRECFENFINDFKNDNSSNSKESFMIKLLDYANNINNK